MKITVKPIFTVVLALTCTMTFGYPPSGGAAADALAPPATENSPAARGELDVALTGNPSTGVTLSPTLRPRSTHGSKEEHEVIEALLSEGGAATATQDPARMQLPPVSSAATRETWRRDRDQLNRSLATWQKLLRAAVVDDQPLTVSALEVLLDSVPAGERQSFFERLAIALDQAWVLRAGGTIEMEGDEGRRASAVGQTEGLLRYLEGRVGPFFPVFEVFPDSSNIGPPEWEILLRRVANANEAKRTLLTFLQRYERAPPHVGGLVVLHGTDTIAHSALVTALDRTPTLIAPVVFTGAMGTIDQEAVVWAAQPVATLRRPPPEAWRNVALAAQVATDPRVPPLVFMAMEDRVHLAGRLKKMIPAAPKDGLAGSPTHFISYGDLAGQLVHGQLQMAEWLTQLQLASRPPAPATLRPFGYVEHLAVNHTTPVRVFEDAVQRLLRMQREDPHLRTGIILQGRFTDRPPEELGRLRDIFGAMTREGIAVFSLSKKNVTGGPIKRVDHRTKTWHEHIVSGLGASCGVRIIEPKTLTAEQARTKLSWLLRQDVPFDSLDAAMNANYVGEVSALTEFPKEHRHDVPAENNYLKGQEVVMGFPGMRAEMIEDAVTRLRSRGDGGRLIVYALGDGNLPVGMRSLQERVDAWLAVTSPTLSAGWRTALPPAGESTPSLSEMDKALQTALRTADIETLTSLLDAYALHRPLARTVHQLIAAARQAAPAKTSAYERTREGFASLYPAWAAALPPSPEEIASATDTQQMRWFSEQVTARIAEATSTELVPVVRRHPEWLSHRLIKDALMSSHSILRALGRATDQGITVHIATLAAEGKSDTRLYELGQMSLAVGANSDITPGWPSIFLPREPAPALVSPNRALLDLAAMGETDPIFQRLATEGTTLLQDYARTQQPLTYLVGSEMLKTATGLATLVALRNAITASGATGLVNVVYVHTESRATLDELLEPSLGVTAAQLFDVVIRDAVTPETIPAIRSRIEADLVARIQTYERRTKSPVAATAVPMTYANTFTLAGGAATETHEMEGPEHALLAQLVSSAVHLVVEHPNREQDSTSVAPYAQPVLATLLAVNRRTVPRSKDDFEMYARSIEFTRDGENPALSIIFTPEPNAGVAVIEEHLNAQRTVDDRV